MARQRWGRRIEFFLTAVGFSVGVGDLWRFPYLVMKNGGGAFLIPIVIFNVVGAMPTVYLEMVMGQYSQTGAVSVWSVCPLMKGAGYGTLVATFLFAIYYAVIICWMLYYFIHSFFPTLPWSSCDNDWNVKETCIATLSDEVTSNVTSNMTSSMTSSITSLMTSTASATTSTMNVTSTEAGLDMLTAAEQFWRYNVLNLSEGLHDLGLINWGVLGCLVAIEVICFVCMFKGVKLSGKVVYFTVLGPFVLLFVFLIRGVILPGSEIGIKFYLTPDFEKLKNFNIWAEACMQVFVSIGPGGGGMITFASYNKFTNNCLRDAILLCLMDLFTGFIGGFVVFSVLGHVSYKTGIDITKFRTSGFGLGFIAYPEAANYLPPPQLWCALFFFMCIFLGIDSQFPNYEIVVTGLRDEFPNVFKTRHILLTLVVIVSAFGLAIPMVTQGGMYLLTLIDWYACTFSVTIIALIEVIIMMFVYGLKNVEANMFEMTGKGIPLFFKICWCFFTPILLGVTLGFTMYGYTPPVYSGYIYPPWSVAMGWCTAAASLAPIPLYAIYILHKGKGNIWQRLKQTSSPSSQWGPQRETEEFKKEERGKNVVDSLQQTDSDNLGLIPLL